MLNEPGNENVGNVRDVLRDYYWFDSDDPEADRFAMLTKIVNSLIADARLLELDLKSGPASKGLPSAWDTMIVELTAAVDRFGLPTTIDKGTDKSASDTMRVGRALRPPSRRRSAARLDDDTAAAIAGIELSELRDGEGSPIGVLKKIKIADKLVALDKLARNLGLLQDKLKTAATQTIPSWS
jgi:hypothetical protein